MKKGVYTLWVFRDEALRPFKIKFPGFFVKSLLIVLLIIIVSFPFIAYHYVSKSLKLARIEKQTAKQSAKMVSLNEKLGEFHQQIRTLKEFDVKLRIIANLENAEETVPFLGVGGLTRSSREPWEKTESDLRRMRAELDYLCTQAKFRERSFRDLYSSLEGKKKQLLHTPSIWPARGWLTSGFGYRIDPFTGLRQFHDGIDIANRTGAPIIAPADGVVSRAFKDFGLGLVLEIKHGYGFVTRYGHLSKIYVKVGKKVKRGERVAAIGNTGRSTGPHLHYEVRLNGVAVNPRRYILN